MTFVLTHENPARQIFCECSAGGSNDKAREKTIVQQDEVSSNIPYIYFPISTFCITGLNMFEYLNGR